MEIKIGFTYRDMYKAKILYAQLRILFAYMDTETKGMLKMRSIFNHKRVDWTPKFNDLFSKIKSRKMCHNFMNKKSFPQKYQTFHVETFC